MIGQPKISFVENEFRLTGQSKIFLSKFTLDTIIISLSLKFYNIAYSFKINSIYKRNSVHLFESAIDLLSYATLKELNNELFNEENLLSLAGVYRPAKIITDSKTPEALSTYLKNNPNIDTIIMHLDNDETGRLATKAIQFSLPDSYKIIDSPPKIGKDYNDYLCIILGKTNNKNYDYYR